MTYAKTIGDRILKVRKEQKYTQEQVSKITGIQRTTLNAIENNGRMPTVAQIIELAKLFQTSVDWLLCLTEIRDYSAIKEKWSKDVYKYVIDFKKDIIRFVTDSIKEM